MRIWCGKGVSRHLVHDTSHLEQGVLCVAPLLGVFDVFPVLSLAPTIGHPWKCPFARGSGHTPETMVLGSPSTEPAHRTGLWGQALSSQLGFSSHRHPLEGAESRL